HTGEDMHTHTHTSLYIQIIFIQKTQTPYYLRIQKNEPIRFDISVLSTSCLIGMSVQRAAAELRLHFNVLLLKMLVLAVMSFIMSGFCEPKTASLLSHSSLSSSLSSSSLSH